MKKVWKRVSVKICMTSSIAGLWYDNLSIQIYVNEFEWNKNIVVL